MAATLFRRIPEQLGPECQSLIDVTLQHRASVKVVARFSSGPPPITNVAVKRPVLPIFLRDERQHECSAAFTQPARVITRWHEQLRINAELKLRFFAVEKAPFHPDQ